MFKGFSIIQTVANSTKFHYYYGRAEFEILFLEFHYFYNDFDTIFFYMIYSI